MKPPQLRDVIIPRQQSAVSALKEERRKNADTEIEEEFEDEEGKDGGKA